MKRSVVLFDEKVSSMLRIILKLRRRWKIVQVDVIIIAFVKYTREQRIKWAFEWQSIDQLNIHNWHLCHIAKIANYIWTTLIVLIIILINLDSLWNYVFINQSKNDLFTNYQAEAYSINFNDHNVKKKKRKL